MAPVSENRTKLFVSHISEESEIAALLKERMEKDFLGLVELFASSDITSINAGEDWLKSVRLAMSEAAAVLVLCSKASIQRPWVQFELGAAWMKQIPIIPVCHSGFKVEDLQMPLSPIQAVQLGTENGLARLYQGVAHVLKLSQVPKPRDLTGLLRRISELEAHFQQDSVKQFERYIDIVIPSPGRLAGESIPDTARVESNDVSMELFGLIGAVGRTWLDISTAARKTADTRWLGQLQQCVSLASRNEVFRPVQAIYHTERASYQPQLAKKETLGDGACRFHVHFVETVVAPLTEVQNDFGLLATLLRLGLRFRYEVVERFQRIPRAARQAAEKDTLRKLRGAIEVIENDALSRGAQNIDPEAVEALFEQEEDRTEMAEIQGTWSEARVSLFKDDPSPAAQEIERIITDMRRINFCFMRLATRRYHEMICARWSTGSTECLAAASQSPALNLCRPNPGFVQ